MRTIRNLCFWAVLCIFAVACSSNDDEVGDWKKVQTFPGKARTAAVSFVIDNKAYVGLGVTEDQDELNDFWVFSGGADENGAWTETDTFPGVRRCAAVAFSDGKCGYVGLGYKMNLKSMGTNKDYYRDFYKYDPSQPEGKRWSRIADFPGQVRTFAVGFYIADADGRGNGLAYVGTGEGEDKEGSYNDYWCYDPATDQWSHKALWYYGEPRKGAVAFVIGKSAYIATGVSGTSDYVTDFVRFTPSNVGHEWESLDPFKDLSGQGFDNDYPQIPRAYAVSFVVGKESDQTARVYIATGSRGSNLSDCWEFNPYKGDLGRWEEVTSFPAMALRQMAVSFVVNNYGYVCVGGSNLAQSAKQSNYVFFPGVDDDDENDD